MGPTIPVLLFLVPPTARTIAQKLCRIALRAHRIVPLYSITTFRISFIVS